MKLRPDAVDIGDMDLDGDTVVVDCDRCGMRGEGCGECVVGTLFGVPPMADWDEDEQRAIDALIAGGLLSRVRALPLTPEAVTTAAPACPAHRRPA